jgi:nitrite reductase/ring-hydroxylating ferredoxin subunit
MNQRSEGGEVAIRLCRLDELPEGDELEGLEFESDEPHRAGIFVLRSGNAACAYVNRCPHLGTPLNWTPNRFLDLDKSHIICATHGAMFRLDDGVCVAGPCSGDALERVPLEVRDGVIYVADWHYAD